jgi:hypothetical protein
MALIHERALRHPVKDLRSFASNLFGNDSDTDTEDHDDKD